MHSPKRVLITGGVRRLGLEIAHGFAKRGATLSLNYHESTPELAQAARQTCLDLGAAEVYLLAGDVTTDAGQIVDSSSANMGGLDLLINNAGVFPGRKQLLELTNEQFERTLGLNLLAPFAMTRSAVRHLPSGGAVINLASLGGVQIWKERIDYNVSKSALITLTKVLARELAPRGITVNAVAPGAIQLEDETAERMGIAPERVPMQRYGSAEDIVRAVLYFAYDAPYVTGQVLVVDGGRSVSG